MIRRLQFLHPIFDRRHKKPLVLPLIAAVMAVYSYAGGQWSERMPAVGLLNDQRSPAVLLAPLAAPQSSTAEHRTVPPQKGIGQGEIVGAASGSVVGADKHMLEFNCQWNEDIYFCVRQGR